LLAKSDLDCDQTGDASFDVVERADFVEQQAQQQQPIAIVQLQNEHTRIDFQFVRAQVQHDGNEIEFIFTSGGGSGRCSRSIVGRRRQIPIRRTPTRYFLFVQFINGLLFKKQIHLVLVLAGSLEGLNMVSGDGSELAIVDVDHDFENMVTNPAGCLVTLNNNNINNNSNSTNGGGSGNKSSEMKFEQTRVASATSTKITHGDGYSSEEATANASHSRRLQADGLHYEESGQAAAMKARLEMDGVTAEKAAAVKQVRFFFSFFLYLSLFLLKFCGCMEFLNFPPKKKKENRQMTIEFFFLVRGISTEKNEKREFSRVTASFL
jgi:hypothetical protein